MRYPPLSLFHFSLPFPSFLLPSYTFPLLIPFLFSFFAPSILPLLFLFFQMSNKTIFTFSFPSPCCSLYHLTPSLSFPSYSLTPSPFLHLPFPLYCTLILLTRNMYFPLWEQNIN